MPTPTAQPTQLDDRAPGFNQGNALTPPPAPGPTTDTRAPGFNRGNPATPAAAPAARRPRRPAAPPPTPARVALVAPWADPTKWDEITIAGITFTGKVTVSGDALKTKSDHRHARGRNGSRHVAAGHDTVEFTVTLSAFPEDDEAEEDQHVQEMDAIYARLSDESPTRQGASAFPVSYPSLSFARINMATVESISLPEFEAGGTLNLTIKFKSFKAPVARPVRTTATPAEGAAPAAITNHGETIAPIDRGPRVPDPPSRSGAAAPR
ncbi:MAG: hypothetical protein JWM10_1940 [Myxococcaceae bacterium]|nr:hypothetical protein [Myxococcaceae bacterium]